MRIIKAKAVISAQDKTGGVFSSIANKVRMLERAGGMMNRTAPMLERAGRAASGWTAGLAGAAGGLGALGGAVVGAKIKDAVVDFAALERQMNRIGITAGASEVETARAMDTVKKTAEDLKMPLDEAVSGLDTLVSSGKSMGEALDFLPSVLATAQASGAAASDMASTASATAVSLKVAAGDMQSAFDAMVTAGKLGTFELKDMAQFMPKVAASARKLGLEGVDGVQRLTAMLQVARQVSGTSEQAATGVTDAFEKLLSPTVLKAASKQGLDFQKIMLAAEKNGTNAFEAIVLKLRDLTKGSTDLENDFRLSAIFTESDSRRTIAAMIKNWDTYQTFLKEIQQGQGGVAKDLARILKDSQAQMDEVTTKFNNQMLGLGQALMPGVSEVLERSQLEVQYFKEQMKDLDDWMTNNLGFSLSDAWGKVQSSTGLGGKTNAEMKADIARKQEERDNPALYRARKLEEERAGLAKSFDSEQQHVDALKGWGYTPAQIAAEVPSYKIYQDKMAELDRQIAGARLSALMASGGRRPADAADRMGARQDAIDSPPLPETMPTGRAPLPPRRPAGSRDAPLPMPAPADLRGGAAGGPVKAVVEGPVTAQVQGQAEVNVRVQVDASPELKALVQEAKRATMSLRSAPTGRSMPEAAPTTGTAPGP